MRAAFVIVQRRLFRPRACPSSCAAISLFSHSRRTLASPQPMMLAAQMQQLAQMNPGFTYPPMPAPQQAAMASSLLRQMQLARSTSTEMERGLLHRGPHGYSTTMNPASRPQTLAERLAVLAQLRATQVMPGPMLPPRVVMTTVPLPSTPPSPPAAEAPAVDTNQVAPEAQACADAAMTDSVPMTCLFL